MVEELQTFCKKIWTCTEMEIQAPLDHALSFWLTQTLHTLLPQHISLYIFKKLWQIMFFYFMSVRKKNMTHYQFYFQSFPSVLQLFAHFFVSSYYRWVALKWFSHCGNIGVAAWVNQEFLTLVTFLLGLTGCRKTWINKMTFPCQKAPELNSLVGPLGTLHLCLQSWHGTCGRAGGMLLARSVRRPAGASARLVGSLQSSMNLWRK